MKYLNKERSLMFSMLGVSIILSGCGGGGGGTSSLYRNTIEGDYLTEYNAQEMLSEVNPLALNDYGYDGSGIKVAVVDSGIDGDHPEFDGKTILGYDFINDSSTGYDSDSNGHGTHVASIIAGARDGSGIRGVAYDATLYSYKQVGGGGTTDSDLKAVYDRHSTDDINVSNNSWGLNYLSTGNEVKVTDYSSAFWLAYYDDTIQSMKNAQSNGTLFVWATGNDTYDEVGILTGLPYHDSDLAAAWLAVTALDENLEEASYTNRCGSEAKDFCVAAPGGGGTSSTGIYAADANTTGYTRMSGTSMAAPHVSGLAAALMEKFPNLTAAQIATRIKSTAGYDGLIDRNGNAASSLTTTQKQEIWGHGLVNAEGASSSVSSLMYLQGNDLSSGVDYEKNPIELSSSLSQSVIKQIKQEDFVVFDAFDGANFTVKGRDIFKETDSSINSYSIDTVKGSMESNNLFKNSDYLFNPVHLSLSNQQNILSNNLFWKDKSNLIDGLPFSKNINSQQVSIISHHDGYVVAPFIRTISDSQVKQAGLMFASEINQNNSYSLSYLTGEQFLDLGHANSKLVDSKLNELSIGMQSNFDEENQVFFSYSKAFIDDTLSSPTSFGLKNTELDAINLGYETLLDNSKLTFGIKKEYALSDGQVDMVIPVQLKSDGTVIYDTKKFEVSSDNKYIPYFAFAKEFEHSSLAFAAKLNKDDNYGALSLNYSLLF